MPTPNLSTAFAVRGQGFNLSGVLRSATTGNPITTGLAGLTGWVSKDDGTFVATTNAPVERNSSGWVSLDLTAAEMTASKVDVMFAATGAVTDCRPIATMSLSPFTGRFDAQPILRYEQMQMDVHAFLTGILSLDGAQYIVRNVDGTLKFQALINEGDVSGSRGAFL